MFNFGVPPTDRWFKDLEGKVFAARTPLSAKKLAARKQQAAEELGELNWRFGNGDEHLWVGVVSADFMASVLASRKSSRSLSVYSQLTSLLILPLTISSLDLALGFALGARFAFKEETGKVRLSNMKMMMCGGECMED